MPNRYYAYADNRYYAYFVGKILIMAEVFLSREIQNEDGYVDDVVNQIKSVPESEELEMLITCIGGDTFQGDRINRAVLEHPNKTKAIAIGVAASMGASLLSAFDEVELDDGLETMLHKARIPDKSEDYTPTPEEIERIENFNKKVYSRFLKKGVDKDFLAKVFLSDSNEDHWLSPSEAEDLGFGKVVSVQRKDGKPYKEAMKIAAKLDISKIKNHFKEDQMGIFSKKEVARLANLHDGRQVMFLSSKEEIEVGNTLTLIGSDEKLSGKVRLSPSIVATLENSKVVAMDEEKEEVDEMSALNQRITDLEQMVKSLIEKSGGEKEEVAAKESQLEEKVKEVENTLEKVSELAATVVEASAKFQTVAKLDKIEHKEVVEVANKSTVEAHKQALREAMTLKPKEN